MNRRILCVDDEEAILKGLKLNMRKDFEIFTANSGDEGLEVFRSSGPFSVVTADMRMPGMDGASMLAAIKERDPDVVSIDPNVVTAVVSRGLKFQPPSRLKVPTALEA